jgi:hypothetical protein
VPAEAIHLSALEDGLDALDPAPRRLLETHREAARLGAVLVDLPYFERFRWEVVRHVTRRPPRPSAWGDRLHRAAPSRVGLELLRAARCARGAREPLPALAPG